MLFRSNNISSIIATIARNTIGLILICLKIIHIDHPMWGLPKVPAAEKIDVSDEGVISGLF